MVDNSSTLKLNVTGIGDVEVDVAERGAGRAFLLLHAGAGPATMNGWADRLAAEKSAHVYTPVHPGFAGTPRPEALNSIRGLAAVYVALLDHYDVHDVTVLGNSIGGWIAAEMAVLGSPRVSSYVLVDPVGIHLAGHPLPKIVHGTPAERSEIRIWFHPEKYPPVEPPAGDEAALAVYATVTEDEVLEDSSLMGRLGGVQTPTLALWGEADGIGDSDYRRAFVDAIPGAELQVIERAGHFPQIETPGELIDRVWSFSCSHAQPQ